MIAGETSTNESGPPKRAALPAHLVVFDAPTPVEVLRLHPVRRWVIRSGRVIAETTPPATHLFHQGREETITFAPPES